MPSTLLLALQLATTPRSPLPIQEFAIDASHTNVEFTVPFALTTIRGRFDQKRGTILYDSITPERSSVTVVIETSSINTGSGTRDRHLRTDDFFDVEKYPTITFQSERVERSGEGWIATGPFALHGVTKQLSIPFRLLAPPQRRPGSFRLALNAVGSLRIARKDFGILGGGTHNAWFTAVQSAAVADSVDITLEVEGWLADAASQRLPQIEAALERIQRQGIAAEIERRRQQRGDKTEAQWHPYFTAADYTVRALIADGRVADAVALSRGWTELFPNLANAWLVHGFALDALRDQEGSARSYTRARQVFKAPVPDPNEPFPQDDPFWYYADELARTAVEWGRVREAVNLARALTGIYGSSARSYVTLGLAQALGGDPAAARASYARALALDPRETKAIEWQRRLKS
jgi:polyisoprenoid-binding protein YceI